MAVETTQERYAEGIGRRKEATARVRLYPASDESFTINGARSLAEYFPTHELQTTATEALRALGDDAPRFTVSAHISGGGIAAQAEALRHGIARALVAREASARAPLKRAGFLKRDPREKERRKFGLKKARKRAQWSKR